MNYSLLLDDNLLKLYYDFKTGKTVDVYLVQKFFSLYQPTFLTTKAQLERINYWDKISTEDSSVASQILASNFDGKSEKDLLDLTDYKIKLTTNNDIFPCVNINESKLKKNYSMFFNIREDRNNAIEMIKSLCASAKQVVVCDRYMFLPKNAKLTKSFFKDLRKNNPNITFYYEICKDTQHLCPEEQACISDIRRSCSLTKCKKLIYKNSHDRYIEIDGKFEIVLSSGIEGLYNSSTKEITVIYRKK
ncbi:MAG: hypothetical protein IJ660_01925 [Alphaproteobacteria bacterium]|nr:hypothetical protein [Alphaproteobacteria bacterium]